MDEILFADATEQAALVARRELSARELLDAHLHQIDRVNPEVNAIVTVVAEQALAAAADADARAARGEPLGPLHGLPVAIKDTHTTAGIRTTFGSPIYASFVPDSDALVVQRLKAAGAVVVGKTNTPEFGAGSQTFNEVFGATRNPYDRTRTSGGSSGGAAAATACGMLPIADGSDLGGSLRNPASFCNVVGFRPSPGRVPVWPALRAWDQLTVQGPIARTVSDAALVLSAMAGPDPRAPISIAQPGEAFAPPLHGEVAGARVACTPDLGRYPLDPAVRAVFDQVPTVLERLGCKVEEAAPDLGGADEIFATLRAAGFAVGYRAEYAQHRDQLKPEVVWNIEQGLALDALAVAAAEAARTELYHRARAFMQRYDFLVLPTSQVPPFSVQERWVRRIDGVEQRTYIDWMASCYAITLTGLPAISVPAAFTPDGLPVGIQIVGRHHRDLDVLRLAYAFEQATHIGRRRPPLADHPHRRTDAPGPAPIAP
jgi:amidase